MMMVDTTIGGVPGVRLNAPVTRQIRNQAMAVARTATQSMAKEVKETVYDGQRRCTGGLGLGVGSSARLKDMPHLHASGSDAVGPRRPAGPNGHCTPTAGARPCWWIQRTRSLLIRPAPLW